ncbi:unnamed protein product [Lampetra fluviatilis]
MGNCCSCCPSWCSCPTRDGYEPLPGENNQGRPRQTPGGAHNEHPAPEPRDTGLPSPPIAAFPAPEPRDTSLPGLPIAAFPAPEPRDTGLPGPPIAASERPGPSSQDEVPAVIVQQPDTPSASGQHPSPPPPPPPPPPALISGMAPTLARPPWLKEKKPYNKKGATERVRCKTGLIEKLQSVTEKQKKALQDKQGNGAPLQKMEFFYLQLVDEGHLSERLRCLRFHFTRAEVLDQARKEQEVMLAALSAVVSSQGLAQLAQLLLFILNFLNEGPTSAPAYGINLCDIDKINSVRMTDPAESGTLLDLVVRECQKSHPDILNVITELEPVDKATRVDDENLTSEWTQKVELLEKGEGEIGAEWERLRVKFSLKEKMPKPLLSSLATFRGDFKATACRVGRRYGREEPSMNNAVSLRAAHHKFASRGHEASMSGR